MDSVEDAKSREMVVSDFALSGSFKFFFFPNIPRSRLGDLFEFSGEVKCTADFAEFFGDVLEDFRTSELSDMSESSLADV